MDKASKQKRIRHKKTMDKSIKLTEHEKSKTRRKMQRQFMD